MAAVTYILTIRDFEDRFRFARLALNYPEGASPPQCLGVEMLLPGCAKPHVVERIIQNSQTGDIVALLKVIGTVNVEREKECYLTAKWQEVPQSDKPATTGGSENFEIDGMKVVLY